MQRLALVTFTCLILGNAGVAAEVDQVRYDKIEKAIEADPKKLLDKSLKDVSDLLELDKVPWDKGYTNYPEGELRIYHFNGFSLTLHLVVLPAGIEPNSKKSYSYTSEDLQRDGVRWLGAFNPFVRIDNINDPKERMKRYWKGVDRGFEERRKQMKKLEGPAPKRR